LTKYVSVAASYERDGIASSHRPTGTTGAVNVSIERFRHVIVDNVRNAIHVDTACCYVGCNHHSVLSIPKTIQSVLSLAL
jgi:hypothetical protein